jgi:L,D-peptidoglycan transpeptidase YkuD (ErfK/YbiS/YcfS/YnhG family)
MLTLALALVLHVQACPQRIVVTVPSARATSASISLLECGRRTAGPWAGHVGYRGVSSRHREGDGTTPLGTFGIGPTIYGVGADPGVELHYHRLVCGDWWDEDPRSPTYNRFRHVACGTTPPFRGGSEALWRERAAYRAFAVVRYNAAPAVPGRGSAIFLHVSTGRPTNGCVSLDEKRLLMLLGRLRPRAQITIRTA